MPLPLPNLDIRRYDDLVAEMRALIPQWAPRWTNHNPSDPGITLIELLAWLTEATLYRLNQTPEEIYWNLIKLQTGSALFFGAEIIDVSLIVRKLQNDSNSSTVAISRFIWDQFDQRTKVLLNDPSSPLPQRKTALAQGLNKILNDNSFWDQKDQTSQNRFAEVSLRPKTQWLIAMKQWLTAQGVTEDDERLITLNPSLNRLLLEDAYPHEIAGNLSLSSARAQAMQWFDEDYRAVTAEDFHDLVLKSFGDRIARARVETNFANGYVTVAIVPLNGYVTVAIVPLPEQTSVESNELCSEVKDFLDQRRLVGTRVRVRLPIFTEVKVDIEVEAIPDADGQQIDLDIVTRIIAFFDPIAGGHEHNGWPFGRPVSIHDISPLLASVSGVKQITRVMLNGDPKPIAIRDLPSLKALQVNGVDVLQELAVFLKELELTVKELDLKTFKDIISRIGVKASFITGLLTIAIIAVPSKNQTITEGGKLCSQIRELLDQRRVEARIRVRLPIYTEVKVAIEVEAIPNTDRQQIDLDIRKRMSEYFDPITGGPKRNGWPFGRPVSIHDIAPLLASVSGVKQITRVVLDGNPKRIESAIEDLPLLADLRVAVV